jgi:hypothetical protein
LKEDFVGNENYLVHILNNDVLLIMIILMNNGEILKLRLKKMIDLNEILDKMLMALLHLRTKEIYENL